MCRYLVTRNKRDLTTAVNAFATAQGVPQIFIGQGACYRKRHAGRGISWLDPKIFAEFAIMPVPSELSAQPALTRHFKNNFQFNRRTERKAGNTVHETARVLFFSKYVLQQLRCGVSYVGVVANIS